ncbi:hypothetical protein [Chitinophaga sp.]|uniref:hypothetical protein n=1 Tax=Chitinophaga sp. TaxID=1869181 RepID=UPI002F930F09
MANTRNYNLYLPVAADPMADVKKNITDNLKILEPVADIPIIAPNTALPQTGNYNIGDRVFRDTGGDANQWPSVYILVVKDADWGWHWRPVQTTMSPWIAMSNAVIQPLAADFTITATTPLSIALDNRGRVWWRGSIGKATSGIPVGDFNILNTIPEGLRPTSDQKRLAATSPVTGGTSGIAAYCGAIMSIQATGATSFRTWGTSVTSKQIWFQGLRYQTGRSYYVGP